MPLSSVETNKGYLPPKKFKPVRGLQGVRLIAEPTFAKTKGNVKGSKRRGLLYQKKVVEFLEDVVPQNWVPIPGPWFEFVDATGHRYAQADWIAIDPTTGFLCLTEIKLTRVPSAWWQLNRLYLPLLQRLFPEYKIGMLEIASNIVNFPLPEPVSLAAKVEDVEVDKTSFMQVKYGRRS